MLPKVLAFFEFKQESSFVIWDTLVFIKWNKDSVDTFSLKIFAFGWSLNFSSGILTGSLKVTVLEPNLSEYSVIPNFIIAFWKYSLSVLVISKSSKIILLLLSLILFSSVLSSSFLSTTTILDYSGPAKLGALGGWGDYGGSWFPKFFRTKEKKKKRHKGKKERFSKQKLLNGCHQGQNIIVLTILESLGVKNCSCRSTMVADNTSQCSMPTPTLKSNSSALLQHTLTIN